MVLRPTPGDPLRDLAVAEELIEAEKQAVAHFREVAELLSGLPARRLAEIAAVFQSIRQNRGVLYVVGGDNRVNTALLLTTELAGSQPPGESPLRVVCLNGSPGQTSDRAGDPGSEETFFNSLEEQLGDQDAVLAISASGRSPNCLKALSFARAQGVKTLGLLGVDGSPAHPLCDLHFSVPSEDFLDKEDSRMEDIYRVVCHAISRILRTAASAEADRRGMAVPSRHSV
ncbi:MAG: hypothetical protein K0U98_25610 [Deltaproteobacteria bacterium]|nr:hypothetical protein [Deltaproteobacteria bacterium]